MNVKTPSLTLASVALASLIGCSTPERLPEYSSAARTGGPADSTIKSAESNGVVVSVEPFADKARCETYFAINAPAAGIAIFHVRVENHSPDITWLLSKAQCRLRVSGQNSSLAQANTSQSTSSGQAMAMTGAVLMGAVTMPVLIGLGGHQIKHATTVQRNFTEKELLDRTLPPGDATEGFLYYQMPQKGSPFHGTLDVSLVNIANQQNNTLQIPIDYEPQ